MGNHRKHDGSASDPKRGYGTWATAVLRGAWASRPDNLPRGDRRRYHLALFALLVGDIAFAFQQCQQVIDLIEDLRSALN